MTIVKACFCCRGKVDSPGEWCAACLPTLTNQDDLYFCGEHNKSVRVSRLDGLAAQMFDGLLAGSFPPEIKE